MQKTKTRDQIPMSIFNQLTMVRLTIDNAKECQRSKTETRPLVPSAPFVPIVPDVRDVFGVHGVSANARCPQKNRTRRNAEFGMSCRRPASQQGLIFQFGIRNLESGIWNSRKPGLKTPERFKCFTSFRHFISFIRFNRFRNLWPL